MKYQPNYSILNLFSNKKSFLFSFIFFVTIAPIASFCQDVATPEEMEQRLETATKEEKIKLLASLSSFYSESDPNKAIDFADDGLDLVKKEKNEQTAQFYNLLGTAYFFKTRFRRSIKNYERELEIIEKRGDKKEIMKARFNIATTLKKMKKERKAIKYYEECRKLAQEIGNKDIVMQTNFALYACHFAIRNYKSSLESFQAYISQKVEQLNIQADRQITVLKTDFELETKEKEITIRKKENVIKKAKEKEQELIEDTTKKAETIEDLTMKEQLLLYQQKLDESELEKKEQVILAEKERASRQYAIVTVLAFLVAIFGGIIYWMIRLYRHNQEANTKLKRQKQEISTQNEIVVKQKKEIEYKSQQIMDSINYAQRIQKAILVPELTAKEYFENSFIYFSPRDVVSGDFYWYSEHSQIMTVAAVDCTGHGVPGAFMSMIGNTLLNEIVNNRKVQDPGQILVELHNGIFTALKQGQPGASTNDGMDISLCTIDLEKNKIYFAGAKNPLYIIRGKELEVIKADYYSIGGKPIRKKKDRGKPFSFVTNEIDIIEGMSIYMFSDGYADQFGGEFERKFNVRKFKELLVDCSSLDSTTQRKILKTRMEEWRGEIPQVDDILVVGIKF